MYVVVIILTGVEKKSVVVGLKGLDAKTNWLVVNLDFDFDRVEAGSNTSTVTLRIWGGDEKEVPNLKE
jgi:hypothetical protein